MLVNTKFICETKKGSLVKKEVVLEYRDGKIYFVKSPFEVKDEIRAMKGSKWHGYDDEPLKQWSVKDCQRNRLQITWLEGDNPFEWFEQPAKKFLPEGYARVSATGEERVLWDVQHRMINNGLTLHYQIIAGCMGCIDGGATVHVNRAGRGMKMTLRDLYEKFHGRMDRGRSWDRGIVTNIRSLKGDTLGLNQVMDVLDKGVKAVLKLTLKSGKVLRLTADHEVCVGYGDAYARADSLKAGDTVLSNGQFVDKDGYVRVTSGVDSFGVNVRKHPRYRTHGVYEHILVAEKKLGRPIGMEEHVHHKNEIRHDNREDNLEVMSGTNHLSHHAKAGGFKHMSGGRSGNGGEVWFAPCIDEVVSVVSDGETQVYDVVCADPYRNFVANGVVVHNCGKTLSAFEIMERSGLPNWVWVGPKTTLLEIQIQTEYWQLQGLNIEFMTYDKLSSLVKSGAYNLPQGIVFDEASKLKTADVARTNAAQEVADKIRAVHGMNGFVITMSGTPSPKTPLDIWSLAEITYPGFLKEGSPKALEQRIAVLKPAEKPGGGGGFYNDRIGWLSEDGLCKKCGLHKQQCKDAQLMDPDSIHTYTPSINEVAHINTRLEGLMTTVFKHECPPLPGKRYVEIALEPTSKLMKVAYAIQRTATSTMQGLSQLRQLSDGFLYRDKKEGKVTCPTCGGTGEIDEWYNPDEPDRPYKSIELMDPEKTKNFVKRKTTCTHCMGEKEIDHIVRETVSVPCPKIEIVEDLLEKAAEDTGRILLFGGFQGSVDRIEETARNAGWEVFRCDGRGSLILDVNGKQVPGVEPLRYWKDKANKKVAFVANPESGGFGLTLVEANIVVFYSNSFKPEFRVQAEERADRPGQTEQVVIYDLLHLPSDKRTLTIIRDNRRLENMVLGDVLGDCFKS